MPDVLTSCQADPHLITPERRRLRPESLRRRMFLFAHVYLLPSPKPSQHGEVYDGKRQQDLQPEGHHQKSLGQATGTDIRR